MRSLLMTAMAIAMVLVPCCGESTDEDISSADSGAAIGERTVEGFSTAWIGSADCVCRGAVPMPEGGWLAAAGCTEPRGYGYGILASISEDGDVSEIARFDGRDMEIGGIISAGDGSFVLFGSDSPTWDDIEMGEMEVVLEDGEILDPDVSADYWVACVDAGGSVIWVRNFSTPADEFCEAVMECPEGGLALAGSSIPADGTPVLRLVRTGADGSVIWDNTYGLPEGQLCEHAILLSDGGFLLGGTVNSIDAQSAMPVFLKVAGDGEEVFLAEYGQEGSGHLRAFVETPQGDIAAVGSRPNGQGGTEAYLTLLSDSCSEEWTMSYAASGFDGIVNDGSNGFIAFGDGRLWRLGPMGDVVGTAEVSGMSDIRISFMMIRGSEAVIGGSAVPQGLEEIAEGSRGFVHLAELP